MNIVGISSATIRASHPKPAPRNAAMYTQLARRPISAAR